jgi:hypothetical protein
MKNEFSNSNIENFLKNKQSKENLLKLNFNAFSSILFKLKEYEEMVKKDHIKNEGNNTL